jgi:Tfp pilus assembly protein PilV
MASPINAGLSLIEVMICSALLVVALEASFSAMGSSYTTKQRTESRSLALAEVQTQIEQLQAMDATAIGTLYRSGTQVFARTTAGSADTVSGPLAAFRAQKDSVSGIRRDYLGCIIPVSSSSGRYCFLIWMGWAEPSGDESVQMYYYYTDRN